MQWLKRNLWKTGIDVAGLLLLLVLMVWLPVPVASAQEEASGSATPGTVTVQATPTVDPTIAAKTAQEQLTKLQRENDRTFQAWFWNSSALLGPVVAGLLAVGGVLWTAKVAQRKNLADSLAERTRRDEERFRAVVEGLSSEREEAKLGAAIMLRTFLHPDYKQFHIQSFDLAVAHLRLPRTPNPPVGFHTSLSTYAPKTAIQAAIRSGLFLLIGVKPRPAGPNSPPHLTALNQALIVVFKEAFPLARSQNPRSPQSLDAADIQLQLLNQIQSQQGTRDDQILKAYLSQDQSLDAGSIQLDRAYLGNADLKQAWMQKASLRKAALYNAHLNEANLNEADLSEADLIMSDLSGVRLLIANLSKANLSKANLFGADLFRANLSEADLRSATLWLTNLSEANLSKANLFGAHLTSANLSKANLSKADLRGTHIENALSLKGTNLREVKGLTKEQLEACKAKGAIIDEDSTTNSSQLPVSPPIPEPRNGTQASSASSAQGSVPTPDAGGSNAASSQQDSEP